MELHAYACHLCDEAMEPDVVAAQGDTCERCYFAHVIPADVAHRLDDGFSTIAEVAGVVLQRFEEMRSEREVERFFLVGALKQRIESIERPEAAPPRECLRCHAQLTLREARANGPSCDACTEAGWEQGRAFLALQ